MPWYFFFYQTDKFSLVEDAYEKAIEYVKNEEKVRPWYFVKVCGYYMKKGRFDDALKVMQKAAEYLPKDAGIHAAKARLYEKMGIMYRAIQEYRAALIIDPKNTMAKRRLDKLTK